MSFFAQAVAIGGRSTGDILLIIGAIGTLLTIFGGILVNAIAAWRKDMTDKIAEVKVIAKATEVNTNSTASRMEAKIDGLQKETASLREQVARQDKDAAVLASAKATSDALAASAQKEMKS